MSSALAARPENLDDARLGFVGADAETAGGPVSVVRAALAKRHPLRETIVLPKPPPGAGSRGTWVSDASERCDAVVLSLSALDEIVEFLELAEELEERGIPSLLLCPSSIGVEVEQAASAHELGHIAVLEVPETEPASSPATALVLSVERALASDPSGVRQFQQTPGHAEADGSCTC